MNLEIEVFDRDQHDRPSRAIVYRLGAGGAILRRVEVAVGQTWRHWREGRRRTGTVHSWTRDVDSVFVDRNTSRRKQAIRLATPLRDYIAPGQ